jgi:ATP-dependent RNA helicase RhlE
LKFEELKLNRQLLNAIESLGYSETTEIQEKAIPQILAGHDIIGIAQTGTGKTAAYTLPLLMKVKYAQGTNVRALILAPTRELVMQIDENVKKLSVNTDIRSVALYGGLGPKTQIELLNKGIDIIIATPGRFLDIYLKGEIPVKEIKTMVLDEADKMMDMGFMPQIRKILEVVPRKRQNLLFSATISPRVEKLTEEFLEFPMKIEVTPQATPAETIQQYLFETPNIKTKINLLTHFLNDKTTHTRVMIFVRSRLVANELEEKIGLLIGARQCRVIHANKGQNSRINAVEAFKNGFIRVLIATDVAARGIDIEEVSHVINFDVPLIYEDYIHRIGRTGRANLAGTAYTFATEADMPHIEKIEKIIRMQIPRELIPSQLIESKTPFEEAQKMAKELDFIRQKNDPTFSGAFHEKKERNSYFINKSKEKKSGFNPKTKKSRPKK